MNNDQSNLEKIYTHVLIKENIQIKYSKGGKRSSRVGGQWTGSKMGEKIKAVISGYSEPVMVYLTDDKGKVVLKEELPFFKDADGVAAATGKILWGLRDGVHNIFITKLDNPKEVLKHFEIPKNYIL